MFPSVQKSTWTYDKEAAMWYFHRFYDFQPDLDTANPYVQAELLKILGFWIQLGVSGFHMNAVPFVIATKGAQVNKPVEQYDMLRTFREFLQWRKSDAIILAEANVLPDTNMKYFGDAGERLQMMCKFQVNQNTFYALASADTGPPQASARGDQAARNRRAVGRVPEKPRLAGLGPPVAARARVRIRGVRPRARDAALSTRHPPSSCTDARWRPSAHRTCIQPADVAGHARRALRR
jgi:glycosidase